MTFSPANRVCRSYPRRTRERRQTRSDIGARARAGRDSIRRALGYTRSTRWTSTWHVWSRSTRTWLKWILATALTRADSASARRPIQRFQSDRCEALPGELLSPLAGALAELGAALR